MTEFTYTDKEKLEIRDAIPLDLGADKVDEVIAKLAEFARAAMAESEHDPRPPYQNEANEQFNDLLDALEALSPRMRGTLDEELNEEDTSVERVVAAVAAAKARLVVSTAAGELMNPELAEAVKSHARLAGELPITGRSRQPAAERFVTRCFFLWLYLTDKMPPKRLRPKSPFYRFVNAAMPPGVYHSSYDYLRSENIHGFVERVCRDARVQARDHERLRWR